MSKTLRWADGDLYNDDATGKFDSVDEENKCAQDLAETLLTPLTTLRGRRKRMFGSELADINIPTGIAAMIGRGLIGTKVTEAVNRLKQLQQEDPASTPNERIAKIDRLYTEEIQPSVYAFWVACSTEADTMAPAQRIAVSLRHRQPSTALQTLNDLAGRLAGGKVA